MLAATHFEAGDAKRLSELEFRNAFCYILE
jgi:hypothetical protein